MTTQTRTETEKNILILGIGNLLLSDEGVGIRVIENLMNNYTIPESIEITDGGTMGIELLPWIEGRTHIIIVDAVRSDNPPGSIIRIDNVPGFFKDRISPHQIGITDVLAIASISDTLPSEVVLIGIEPESLSGGLELSGTVAGKIDEITERVIDEVARAGVTLECSENNV